MYDVLKWFWEEEDAQDLAEYALLMMLVSLTAIVALHTLAATTDRMFFRAAYALFKHHMSPE